MKIRKNNGKAFSFFHNTGIWKGTELDTSDIRACDHSLVDCDSAHGGQCLLSVVSSNTLILSIHRLTID